MRILGNEELRRRLARSLARGGPAPAYLFLGPPGLGKALTARWLACLVLCSERTGTDTPEPCGRCRDCLRVQADCHPDVTLAERPEGKPTLGVGEVREGIGAAAFHPYEGRHRLWIFPEAERLTEEAQNALLKTLEEPPGHLVMVLVAPGEEALLPTVVSRCLACRFAPVSLADLEAFLAGQGVEPERAAVLARVAQGRPGLALALAREPRLWELRQRVLQGLEGLRPDMWSCLELAAALEKASGTDARSHTEKVLDFCLSWYRDLACLASGASADLVINVDHLEGLRQAARRVGPAQALAGAERILGAERLLRQNVQPRLLLQDLCLSLGSAHRPASSG